MIKTAPRKGEMTTCFIIIIINSLDGSKEALAAQRYARIPSAQNLLFR